MYTDIFRFNLNDLQSNIIILIVLYIIISKFNLRMNTRVKITIFIRLVISLIPNRLILQGGINVWYICLIGLTYSFISNYMRFNKYKLVPTCPITIIPLIIIIEIVRYLIRPLSLILRILINITIGHIVMYILWYPLSFIYRLIEIWVYAIQMYIFWVLISIYGRTKIIE